MLTENFLGSGGSNKGWLKDGHYIVGPGILNETTEYFYNFHKTIWKIPRFNENFITLIIFENILNFLRKLDHSNNIET